MCSEMWWKAYLLKEYLMAIAFLLTRPPVAAIFAGWESLLFAVIVIGFAILCLVASVLRICECWKWWATSKAQFNLSMSELRLFKMLFGAVAIVALFSCLGLLLPQVRSGPSSRHAQCKNNLKQIGVAMDGYRTDRAMFPGAAAGNPPMSWRVAILPQLGHGALALKYNQLIGWNIAPNAGLAQQEITVYRCPSDHDPKDAQGRWFTAYSMITGPHTIGGNLNGTPIEAITDGTSNTLLLVEACGQKIIWTEPRDVDFSVEKISIAPNDPRRPQSAGSMASNHAGGIHVLMADGRVAFISQNLEPAVLKKLATVDGGEEVGDF